MCGIYSGIRRSEAKEKTNSTFFTGTNPKVKNEFSGERPKGVRMKMVYLYGIVPLL
jgi:hypothetical protein